MATYLNPILKKRRQQKLLQGSKKLEFQLALGRSSSHILLVLGKSLFALLWVSWQTALLFPCPAGK